MQDQDMQARLQAALDTCARMQDQRDQLAAQLKDATAQCGVMADLVNRMVTMMVMAGDEAESGSCNPVKAWMFEAQEALAGKLPVPAVTVTETIRTAPVRIWLQIGDQAHYHSEPFPRDTGEVTWCADSVVGCEVPYVRADLAAQMPGSEYMQGAADFKQELIKATKVFVHPHIEGVFAVFEGRHERAMVTPAPERTIPDELPDLVLERTAEAMGEAYDCSRSWSAWGYGTMGASDFQLVGEDSERVSEIAMAAITAWEESAKQEGGA